MHKEDNLYSLTIFTSAPLGTMGDSNPTKTRFTVRRVFQKRTSPAKEFSPTKVSAPTRNSPLLSFPLAEASKGTTRFEKAAKMKYVLVSGGVISGIGKGVIGTCALESAHNV
ncbi:hypothetical protein N431DRAFT_74158 [Stipitochalara longipes BDJ]|nr:hypothetical protein N431DRAFT_74158 [Stipitochalara longipes BDJ]